MDDIFNNESIWAFRVHYTSRLTEDIEDARKEIQVNEPSVVQLEFAQEGHEIGKQLI